MGAQKRKRSDLKAEDVNGNGGTGAAHRIYKTGKEIQSAIEFASKDSLSAVNNQVRVPFSQQPIPITHPNVVLIQNYLALSPKMDEIFQAWKTGVERKQEGVMEGAVQLLSTIVALLTPLPYFRPILMTVADKVLDAGEMYSNSLCRLVLSSKRDHSQIGMMLVTALAYIDPSAITSSSSVAETVKSGRHGDGSNHVSRLTLNVWTTLANGGCLKVLPKLLSMRRKGGFAVDADPLDRPDIRHLTLRFMSAYFSHPLFLSASKQLLAPLFANMKDDPPLTIARIFQALWNHLNASGSAGVNRRTAVSLLTEQSIEGILRLYGRNSMDEATSKTGNVTPAEMAHEFLLKTCTKPGTGICFADQGWYKRKGKARLTDLMSGTNEDALAVGPADVEEDSGRAEGGIFGVGMVHNKVLGNVIRKVGPKTADDARMAQLVEAILRACPELVGGYWPHSGLSVEPRLNAKWLATVAFLGRITLLPIPDMSTFYLQSSLPAELSGVPERIPKATPPTVATMIEAILPAPLTKAHLTKGLSHSVGLLQHQTALALTRCLRKLWRVQQLLAKIGADAQDDLAENEREKENVWIRCSRELEMEARKRVPEVGVVIAFAQKSAASQALQASLEEEDSSAKAKAELLTESALRLFGLYYQALPTMAAEFKFDVGKLLVSASSAKAEAQARRAAREGSVVDETGSIASIGTTGTAGMGGGFGQARGDVEAFDALSQIHVLELLANVREWDWTGKAAGSAFTYLYHILQLYLATPHANTKAMAEVLLHQALGTSIMFDHDPAELALWLEMLPRTRRMAIKPSPTTILERLQLLSFLDDCVRRCIKTPYRYLEDVTAFMNEEAISAAEAREAPSPLLFTVFEQLQAKLAGHHIAASAGQVILDYVSLLILAFSRKVSNLQVALALSRRLESCVIQAETKRESALESLRQTCAELLSRVRQLAGEVEGAEQKEFPSIYVEGEDEGEVLRRQLLKASTPNFTFRQTLLSMTDGESIDYSRAIPFEVTLCNVDFKDNNSVAYLEKFYLRTDNEERLPGYCNTLLQGLHEEMASNPSSKVSAILSAISTTLSVLRASDNPVVFERTKSRVFGAKALMDILIAKSANTIVESSISQLVALLHADSARDRAIAGPIINSIDEILSSSSDLDPHTLQALVSRWASFFDGPLASRALPIYLATIKAKSEGVKQAAGTLLESVESPFPILQNLQSIAQLGWQNLAVNALRRWIPGVQHCAESTGKQMETAWKELAKRDDRSALDIPLKLDALPSFEDVDVQLFTVAAQVSSTLRNASRSRLQSLQWNIDLLLRLAPLVVACFGHVDDLSVLDATFWQTTSLCAFERNADPAIQLIEIAVKSSTSSLDTVAATLNELLTQRKFKASTKSLHLVNMLLTIHSRTTVSLERSKIVDACIHTLVRELSSQATVGPEILSFIEIFTQTLSLVDSEAVSAYMAEPILTSVVQSHVTDNAAVQLACTLMDKADFKTTAIRQQLQLLLFHPEWDKLMQNDPKGNHRRNVAAYAKALFKASPYVACQPSFMEPLLAIFQASQMAADRDIVEIMQIFERQRKASISGLLKLWKGPGSLTAITTDCIGLEHIRRLDPHKVFATCLTFESRQTAFQAESRLSGFYDVTFVLSLIALTFREGNLNGLDMVEILRSNVIGLACCGLASKQGDIRALSAKILGSAIAIIGRIAFQEKTVVTRILRLLRHGVQPPIDPSKSSAPSRIPFVMAVFFAHALRTTADPSSFLYPLISKFLLQRPTVDFNDVPMLYNLLYSAGQGSKKQRRWMARFIRDGVRSRADWRILQRRHSFALLASVYESTKDVLLQQTILQAVGAMVKIDDAVIQLTEREGLLSWLYTILQEPTLSAESYQAIAQILEDVTLIMNRKEQRRRDRLTALPDADKFSLHVPRRWVPELCSCIESLSGHSDLSRLRTLSETLLRIALMNPEMDTTYTVASLTERLRQLDLDSDLTANADWSATVHALCRCGLLWVDSADSRIAVSVMQRLTARAATLDNELSRWLIREWEASRQE